jgi:predicted nicotinamide N-methyase
VVITNFSARAAYSPEALTDPPRAATQQVIEFAAGAAVPNPVDAASAADGTLDAGAPAPASIPSGGKDG